MTLRRRPRRAPALLLAALALAGCARATSGFEPWAGEGVVDDSYAVVRQTWNSGDAFRFAFALKPAGGRAALCGAVGREPSGGLRGVLDPRLLRNVTVTRGDAQVAKGIAFFAGPFEGADLRGRPSNCVATALPWTEDMADPSSLRFSGPLLLFL